MNMPSFTAEASLFKTSGHYQTTRNAINLAAHTGCTIEPALGISDEGPIEVHSCRPGTVQIGEGQNMVCVDPSDPFGTRGHDGGGGGGGDGVPTDGGGGERPPEETHGCTYKQVQSPEADSCIKQMEKDIKAGLEFEHYLRCSRDKKGNPIMACCQDYRDIRGSRHRRCTPIKSK
jgi:hypothetical protein